jgi:RimJ/RimL family protein N-acetyltransferase
VSVSLRRAVPADAGFLLELSTRDDIRPFLGRVADTQEAVLAEIARSDAEAALYGRFVIEVDELRAGTIGFHCVNERHRIAEAGRFALLPEHRGTGVADEAARLFQRHLLVELGFHRIELQIFSFNERAIAHAERVGFVREGVKRRAYLRDGEWKDAVLFSLLAEEL